MKTENTMIMETMLPISKICVKDKKFGNYSNYLLLGCGMEIEHINGDRAGFLTGWKLVINGRAYKGSSVEDFIKLLHELLIYYDLKEYSKYKKDIIVIYIDNLKKLQGFFYNHLTAMYRYNIQILNHFEFRGCWREDLHTAEEISEYAKQLIDNIFLPEKFFYVTPNQAVRKHIQKRALEYNNNIAKEISPSTFEEYKYVKRAFFGGLCYCPYRGLIVDDPIIEIDLKSAYIYCLLVELHCMSKGEIVDNSYWEYYLDSPSKVSIGTYKINFTCSTNKASCFKDSEGNKIKIGNYTQKFVLTSIDLKLLMDLVTIHDIDCEFLIEYKVDTIPEYMREVILEEYFKKEELRDNKVLYDLQKTIVNGIYGNCIRKLLTRESWKFNNENSKINPLWGIFTSSYCRRLIITLGNKLKGWYYTDTDSIFCLDTPENRKHIEEFNAEIQEKVLAFCNKFGYDFDKLKLLGNFIIENEITKLKTFKPKTYAFKTKDGKVIRKAAGCNREQSIDEEDLFNLQDIPLGKRVFSFIETKPYTEVIDGVEYHSDCSYIEYTLDGEASEIANELLLMYLQEKRNML